MRPALARMGQSSGHEGPQSQGAENMWALTQNPSCSSDSWPLLLSSAGQQGTETQPPPSSPLSRVTGSALSAPESLEVG